MNRNEVIKQLKELREHCKYQATSGETMWNEDVQALNYAIDELEETDQEVPVQEQFKNKCEECKKLNKAMDIMMTLQWNGFDNYLSALAYDRETETILIDEESLMRAIQIANPIQKHRKLKLITR